MSGQMPLLGELAPGVTFAELRPKRPRKPSKPKTVLTELQLAEKDLRRCKRVYADAKTALRQGRTEKPLQCVTLNIDTAKKSGWAVAVAGIYIDSGEVDTRDPSAVEVVVQMAARQAELSTLPMVIVLEKGFGANGTVAAALGEMRGRWLVPWRKYAGRDKNRIAYTFAVTWRRIVLDKKFSGGKSANRADAQAAEQALARRITSRFVGEEEAPAIGICVWSSKSTLVEFRLAKGSWSPVTRQLVEAMAAARAGVAEAKARVRQLGGKA